MSQTDQDFNESLFLLPVDMRRWIPENDIVYFVSEAVKYIPSDRFVSVKAGLDGGYISSQAILALLLFGYTNDVFSSSRLENLARYNMRYRYVSMNTQPGRDSIFNFRQQNRVAIAKNFLIILKVAFELNIPKVGNVDIEGIRVKASASTEGGKQDYAKVVIEQELKLQIEEMIQEGEKLDTERGGEIGQQYLPGELTQHDQLKTLLGKAFSKVEDEES